MWQIYIDDGRIRELCLKHNYDLREVPLTVRVTEIRDGNYGISLTIGDNIVGEWMDSQADSLQLDEDYKMIVQGIQGCARYGLIPPGNTISAEEISGSEVSLILEL